MIVNFCFSVRILSYGQYKLINISAGAYLLSIICMDKILHQKLVRTSLDFKRRQDLDRKCVSRCQMIKTLPRVSATSKVVYHGEDDINYSDYYRLEDVK